MNNPKLYTVKEAAKLVGVSTNTLYKYLDEDRIHAARGSAIQGRFRIPQSALEEFLGISLAEPEPAKLESVSETPQVTSNTEVHPKSLEQVRSLPLSSAKLPLKIIRFLLLLSLLAVLIDLFISRSVSLPGQISRLFFLIIMLLLAYQEGGFRRT